MNVIETVTEFESFLNSNKAYDWIVVPIYCNGHKPVYADSISVIFIYVLQKDIEVILILNHTEGLAMPASILTQFPDTNRIFIYGKKRFLHFLKSSNLIDIDLLEYFLRNQPMDDDFETSAHEFFTSKFERFNNLNCIIPVVKHVEKCQKIVSRFLQIYDRVQIDESFNYYNNLVLDSLFELERVGLRIHDEVLQINFPNTAVYDHFIYSEYNIYTTTGRPSNRFGGINFAALNKENGSRGSFISRFGTNGFLISFDYDAYHLRLLADLIDYQFPSDISVHEYLGKIYFDKEKLTEAEYLESKAISFRQLYGGIGHEYLTIDFFEKVHEYTQLLWKQYNDQGFIDTPLFSRKLFQSFFTGMNAAKLLNYLLQTYETERNMAVIHNILQRTQSFSSKLILYTYDSFLFDFNTTDGKEFIEIVKEELQQNGKFPIKIEIGPDYNRMTTVKRSI